MGSLYREQGPAPKRSEERARREEPSVATTKINVVELIQREVEIPTPDPEWHSVAIFWYESLAESAQCVYYEPSDWAIAYVAATNLSRQLQPQFVHYDEENSKSILAVRPLKGADMAAFLKVCTNLLVTEVDRRRAGIEIERAIQLQDLDALTEDSGNVVSFEDARQAAVGN
jgi:hypothetical protein